MSSRNKEELNRIYDMWINNIAKKCTPREINGHLIKHLNEEIKDYKSWIISAGNLIDIYNKVAGVGKNSELIRKYTSLINDYTKESNRITIRSKLNKLFIHFKKYPDTATPPPVDMLKYLNFT